MAMSSRRTTRMALVLMLLVAGAATIDGVRTWRQQRWNALIAAAQVPAESFVRLWTSRRRLYYRYHSPALNAVLKPLVQLAMRQRIRANHRRSQRGQMPADERAAMNQALTSVIEVWQRRRPPL